MPVTSVKVAVNDESPPMCREMLMAIGVVAECAINDVVTTGAAPSALLMNAALPADTIEPTADVAQAAEHGDGERYGRGPEQKVNVLRPREIVGV